MPYTVKVIESKFINHDVKTFKVEKPKGYKFIPGQATWLSVNEKDWKKKKRPFTFTGLTSWEHLEFIIKIYPDPTGVTRTLGRINAGEELIIEDAFGAIQYKGTGVFISGGAGVTPFVSIFRDLYYKDKINGNKLICSNRTSEDVILMDELKKMLKKDYINLYTREKSIGFSHRRVDRNFLIDNISDFSQYFYVCGPEDFVRNITQLLQDLGVKPDTLVIEPPENLSR